jgi:pimeloyl-ACP methyl ester carboxylesterase
MTLDPPTSSTLVVPATTSSTSTTTPIATTTSEVATTTDSAEVDAQVDVPSGDGPFPAVVLVHGGGWVTGSPDLLSPLAEFLVEHGYLTVNTRYQLADFDKAGFPDAVDDVACAVRFAATHPDSDGTVTVIGHSAGAHIGALVALTGDRYAADCPHPGSGVPERFVGLAGPYDVSRLGIAIVAFLTWPSEGRRVPGPIAPITKRGRSPPTWAIASWASRAAARLISNARSASSNSPSVIGEPPKVLVSMASAPASR